MLEVGWSEILVIALVLIIVVGPKDLPPMLRTFGRMAARLRGMANEFKGQFDQALREAELDDVRKGLSEVNKINPTNSLRDAINPIRQLGQDIKADLQKASDAVKAPASAPFMKTESELAAEEAAKAAGEKPEEINLGDLVPEAKPAEAVAPPAASPIIQAAVAPVVPPAADKAGEVNPVASQPVANGVAPAAAETVAPKPKAARAKKTVSEAAIEAEPKAKKPSSRKKPAVTEAVPDAIVAEAAKPKKTARKKTEKTGDA